MNQPIISVQDLTKKFKDFTAVDGINLEVASGDVFAFIGPNGAGKTTTIKMLTTLLNPTSGKITVNGFDPATEQDEVRRSFGIVFQDPSLDEELTADENLFLHATLYNLPRVDQKKKIDQLLQLVELTDRRGDLVQNFSGGMKRRLEIARSLIHEPKILFLDEPTLGLDPQTRNHVWEYVRKLNQERGMTLFLTTHYMEEAAKLANKVAIIDHGKIIANGTPEELIKQTGTATLEEAYLKLSGSAIRPEEASGADHMRMRSKVWGRRS